MCRTIPPHYFDTLEEKPNFKYMQRHDLKQQQWQFCQQTKGQLSKALYIKRINIDARRYEF